MNQVQDDEIDLIELFQTLWDGKWLISAFVAIAVLIGGSFLLLKDAVFQSKLIYSMDTIPPFYVAARESAYLADKVAIDFQKKFYSVSVFEEWKQKNSDRSLVFEDFNPTEVVDGFVVSKNEDELLATLASDEETRSFILVKSNQLPLLDDFFEYANHINGLLTELYIARAKEELKIIDTRFKDSNSSSGNITDTVRSIDRYIVSAEKGATVLAIQRPTLPKKVSPKSSKILAFSVFLGGIVGVFFILVRNAMTKRKGQLVKG